MKIFDKATLKLTAIYTGILMLTTVIFSVAIAVIIMGEVRQPMQIPSIFQQLRVDEDFANAYRSRADKVESRIVASLILVNVNVFIVGALASYQLARHTLKPIEKAMDDESRFVSDASHELRTPLATMRMETEVTLRDRDAKKEEYRQQLQSNLEEIDKLRAMVDSLLKMSSSAEITIAKQDIEPIVDMAIGRVARQAEAKDIAIDKQIQPFQAVCNEDALSEILYVYLDNAIKYSARGATIRIANYGSRGIAVVDAGPGIADKDLPNIFNRFYRADESRNSDGFGLGLSLAARLAERTGAKIEAFNNATKEQPAAKGATFAVTMK